MIKMMPLKQVCSGIIDCPHESPEWLSKGIPVIRNFNLVDGQIDMSDASYVDESTYTKRTRRAVPSAGDIIFSREAPIGNCAIVPADFKCCLGQRLVLLRVNREICSPEYLLAALLSDFVKTQIFQVEKSGSIVSNFNISDLGDLIIPIIDRQESVASVSDTLNKKLLINKNICAELEAMAKTLYDYWFTQFDFPDKNGKPYRSSGGEMVWNDQLKREIPKGWSVKKLSDICTFRNGINYEKDCVGDRTYRIANVRNITASSLLMDASDFDEISLPKGQADRYVINENDIIIARSGTPGATRLIVSPADNVIFCGFIICGAPYNSKQKLFLAYFLKQLEGTSATKTGGSILQNVSQDTLKSLHVCLPNDVVLDSFNKKIKPIIGTIQNIIDENHELTKLRDWLLPMLMNGQAAVSD